MELKSLKFGRDTAEFDKNLSEYFLATPAYESVLTGDKSIVTGRKGTGKTAIVKYLVENENKSLQYILKIEASHSTYIKIDENLKSFTSQVKNLDSSFKLGWLFTTLISLIDRITKEKTILITKEETQIYDYAKKELGYDSSDPISAISGYVFSWIKNLKSIGPVGREIESKKIPDIFDEPRIMELICSGLSRIVKSGKSVFLLYDRLDERWDGSDLYIAFLQGLMLAIKDIKSSLDNVYPVMFLRDDIFDKVSSSFQHIDHYRMEIQPISWDESSLLDLIAKRLFVSMQSAGSKPKDTKPETLWNGAFPEKIPAKRAAQPAYVYMIERTLSRPRDIILFCNLALNQAKADRLKIISCSSIKTAEIQYSSMKLGDLIAECSYHLPCLEQLTAGFKRNTIGYDRDDLYYKILEIVETIPNPPVWLRDEPANICKYLYNIGFLSYTQRGGILRGNRVVHSAIERDPNIILEQERIYISPIFRKALDLHEK